MTELSTPPSRLTYTTKSPVPGLAVAVQRVSSPRATLVCVHGGLDRGASFSRVARRLPQSDVISYDRRGYQGSRGLGVGNLDNHVNDLLAIIDDEQQRSPTPIFIFGHSFGGVIAMAASVANPVQISRTFTYESPAPWVKSRPSGRPPLGDDGADEAERFFKRVVSRSAWERLSPMEKESRRLDGTALIADLQQLSDRRELVKVSTISVPTHYIYGDGILVDYYHTLADELVALNPLINVETLEHAGHGAHLSAPDQLATVFRRLSDLS